MQSWALLLVVFYVVIDEQFSQMFLSEISNAFTILTNNQFEIMGSRTVTLERRAQLIQELHEVFNECSIENWDGYGALPIQEKAVLEAERFFAVMPAFIPDPEIAPEPGGDIGLQWSFGENRILTVSFEGRDIITYAAILAHL